MDRRQFLYGATAAATVLAGGATASPALALGVPRAVLWERWTQHDPNATAAIDHAAWDRLLRTHVSAHPDGINRVNYRGVSAADRQALGAYIDGLAATPIGRFNRDQQRAYWTNLYNALTVRLVLDHYPIESIRDIAISPGLFAIGPWGRKLIAVEGEDVSLDDIEHRILRPIWRDPLIHYAVNCAALGCPNLMRQAFTAGNAPALLAAAARAYVNHPRGARVDAGRLIVSSIYDWFQADFGGSAVGVIAHLRRYADPDLTARLAGITRIHDHGYDWRLNDAATAS